MTRVLCLQPRPEEDGQVVASSGACILSLMYSPLVSSSSRLDEEGGLFGDSPKLLVGLIFIFCMKCMLFCVARLLDIQTFRHKWGPVSEIKATKSKQATVH